MKKIQTIVFFLLGITILILGEFSPIIIAILLAIITKAYMTILIIVIVFYILIFWRHFTYKKQGLKPKIGQYE